MSVYRKIQSAPSFAQSLLKGRKTPIWCQRDPNHTRLSGTDGLIYIFFEILTEFSWFVGFTCLPQIRGLVAL